ncbi:MAG: RHS repeat-associated core domain-containing protein [Verrucomicrobiales bacterium]|nr:RHS repeat-associated core domain-containing protein [Verrucomicrobiales bacterium]
MAKTSDSSKTAHYEYGPFGEVVRASGTIAKSNPMRFSTKCQDEESDLLYYGYRFYNASTGRWPSRDPVAEEGGVNLFMFALNAPISTLDYLGFVSIRKGDVLAVNKNGKKVGEVKIDTYRPDSFASFFGALLEISVNVNHELACNCFYRWRQRFTVQDEKGFLSEDGIVLNNVLDPLSDSDDKEWYFTNKERPVSPDGISEFFEDQPRRIRERVFGSKNVPEAPILRKRLRWKATLELVEVPNLSVAGGGTPVVTIEWGFQSDIAGRDKLLTR